MKAADGEEMDFSPVGLCENPMESEIFPAALRDKEIPHRTRWDPDGNLILEVPREWREEAARVLGEAARTFFAEEFQVLDEGTLEAARAAAAERRRRHAGESAAETEEEDEDDEDDGMLFRSRDGLFRERPYVPSSALRSRPVWPAWLLAAIPGLGLGHVYAGRARVALPLLLFTVTCLAYFLWSGSAAVLFFIAVPWAVDLGFAAYHVKSRNREMETLRQRAEEEERKLISQLEGGKDGRDA